MAKQEHMDAAKHHNEAANHHMAAASKHDAGTITPISTKQYPAPANSRFQRPGSTQISRRSWGTLVPSAPQ